VKGERTKDKGKRLEGMKAWRLESSEDRKLFVELKG
jgi:hypothetical protein